VSAGPVETKYSALIKDQGPPAKSVGLLFLQEKGVGLKSEPGLRGELLVSGAENVWYGLTRKAVWSEAI
jgi:hypothetical protein